MKINKRAKKAKEKVKARKQLLDVVREEFPEFFGVSKLPDEDNKRGKKITRDSRGRPTVMTIQRLGILRFAFCIGCTDSEACKFAKINEDTLYAYCKEHPEFSEEKEDLKENPVLYSRMNVFMNIRNGSVQDSWEMLRRKRKEEFAEMRKTTLRVEKALTPEEIEAGAVGDVLLTEEEEDDE